MAKVYTYDDPSIRESLLGVITNIDPTESQLLSGLGMSSADQIYHQWLTETLKTPGVNAQVEGSDATFAARTQPARKANYTQIVRIDYDVTDTERAVVNAGFEDRLAHERDKAAKEWRNDAEFALMRATLNSGTGSAARQMQGLKASITTVATSQSGVSLNETTFNAYLGNTWEEGGNVDEIYVGRVLKQRISGFSGAANQKTVAVTDKRLVNTVDIYESDFGGVVKLFKHRYVTADNDVNLDIVGIDSEYWKVAYLNGRQPKVTELAKTGSSSKEMMEGELTLEFRAENSSFIGQRHL